MAFLLGIGYRGFNGLIGCKIASYSVRVHPQSGTGPDAS